MLNVSRPVPSGKWSLASLPASLFASLSSSQSVVGISCASLFLALLSAFATPAACAEAAPPVTMLDRQLARIDFGVTAAGQFTKDVAGTNYLNQNVTQKASTTVAFHASLRYTIKPFIGFEANYLQARYTENFSPNVNVQGGVQTKAAEYTLGYVIHPRSIFGLNPFVSAGLGATAFIPTAGGGQGLPEQARMTYYYNVGVDAPVFTHMGLRVSARQAFFKAPDFGQNYITINQRTNTFEPSVGFYLKF